MSFRLAFSFNELAYKYLLKCIPLAGKTVCKPDIERFGWTPPSGQIENLFYIRIKHYFKNQKTLSLLKFMNNSVGKM